MFAKRVFDRNTWWAALLVLQLLTATALQSQSKQQLCRVTEGIVFYRGADFDLKLDLAQPTTGSPPYPAIVFVHGGGWGFYPTGRSEYYIDIRQAAKSGFVAATIDYRLTIERQEDGRAKYRFPDQLYDVKRAVRWMRKNSTALQLDPDNIGAIGWSAGAHLVLLLGLTVPQDGLEGPVEPNSESSRIQALVSIAGFSNLALLYNETGANPERISIFLGGTPEQIPDRYRAASPLTYVRPGSPPMLIIHGDRDGAAPLNQALLLDRRLTDVGAKHVLVVKANSGHENYPLDETILSFLRENLSPK